MSSAKRAKLFKTGGSQAVRLPRDCRFSGSEVYIRKEGTRVILEPVERGWSPEFLAEFQRPLSAVLPEREQPTAPDRRPESIE